MTDVRESEVVYVVFKHHYTAYIADVRTLTVSHYDTVQDAEKLHLLRHGLKLLCHVEDVEFWGT